jgi:hypothetical protein
MNKGDEADFVLYDRLEVILHSNTETNVDRRYRIQY